MSPFTMPGGSGWPLRGGSPNAGIPNQGEYRIVVGDGSAVGVALPSPASDELIGYERAKPLEFKPVVNAIVFKVG